MLQDSLKDVQRDARLDQEKLNMAISAMTEKLENGIRRKEYVVEQCERAIRDAELPDENKDINPEQNSHTGVQQEDLHHLAEQYESVKHRLETAQMELVQRPKLW